MGSELVGEYKITSKCRDTVAEQTIKEHYDKEKKMRITTIDKETKNIKGNSVKLLGSKFMFTEGYPPLLFDAVILKVNGKTTTIFNAFFCTVTSQQHMDIFDLEVEKALKGIEFSSFKDASKTPEYIRAFPEFMIRCGFNVQRDGEHLDILDKLKVVASDAYEKVLKSPPSECPVEKLRDYLINELSRKEHLMFAQLGLSVPTKCQKAMFTLMAEESDLEDLPPTEMKKLL